MFDGSAGAAQIAIGDDRPEAPLINDATVEEFVDLLLHHSIEVPTQYINALIDDGAQLKNIYLDLLAPAARELGFMWEEDHCNFTQVTVGVARMHQLLHMFSPVFCAHHSTDPDCDNSALIVPIPGEQHTFGHIMVVEFFRRAGWNVWSGSPNTDDEILDIVARQPFTVVGFSIGADRHLDRLREMLDRVRARSANERVKILVGGRVFSETDRNPRDYGADGSALDGEEAVEIAAGLV